jgi:hypothetical protein
MKDVKDDQYQRSKTATTCEDMEKLEPLCTAGGNVNDKGHQEKL